MENVQEERKGELLIFLHALSWAIFPIIAVLSYALLPSLVSLAWSTALATLSFAVLITYRGKWKELNNSLLWKYGFFISLFNGFLYYVLYFIGLETTTPGNAAIISLFEVFTSFLLFQMFRGEHISFDYKIGGVLMVVGAGIVLGKDFSGINYGDIFILLATVCAPAGNLFQQKARNIASSEAIMFIRNFISVPPIFILAYVLQAHVSFGDLRSSLIFLLVNGVLLLGLSKILWIEGIHRVSVTKASALGGITPFLTLLFAWLILQQTPTVWQLASLAPILLGVLLLTDNIKLGGRAKHHPLSQP